MKKKRDYTEELKKRIAECEKEIAKEPKFSKRWCFLASTINRYNKELGNPAPYTW